MATTYTYPSNAALKKIERNLLPVLTQDDPIFSIMPIEEVDAPVVMWEQEDDYIGLQQVRGYNGKPATVKNVGGKRYVMEPGIYGEMAWIDELELTMRRPYGEFNGNVDITDLIRKRQDQLLTRRYNRIKQIGWSLLATGTFSVTGPDGLVHHTDTVALQTASASVAWGTSATAKPLVDFRTWKLLQRGHSLSFGRGARAFANTTTVNKLLNNTNSSDIAGKRVGGGDTVNMLGDFNRILMDNDLPEVVEYDQGYLDASGTFQLFIPDDKVIIIGKRTDGGRIAGYQMTRNAQNEMMAPGAYVKVVDDPDAVPRLIEIHDGHNGGPAFYFPSAVIIASV